jgi:hypothetical protein
MVASAPRDSHLLGWDYNGKLKPVHILGPYLLMINFNNVPRSLKWSIPFLYSGYNFECILALTSVNSSHGSP